MNTRAADTEGVLTSMCAEGSETSERAQSDAGLLEQLTETILWTHFLEGFLYGVRESNGDLSNHQQIEAANKVWRDGVRDEWVRKLKVRDVKEGSG
jgi:hypothetical protein